MTPTNADQQTTAAPPLALVTGASAGIGQAFAERLARDGYDLVLVARRRERLEALARRLHEQHGSAVEVLVADLTQPAPCRAVEARLSSDDQLSLLVNNAGFAAYYPFIELAPDALEAQIQLQVVALVRLTRAALPGMIARGHGAIINLSSGLAFSAGQSGPALPKRAVYAATKAFVNSFSEIVQSELAGSGVQVQALCPGPVRTEFFALTGMDLARFPPGTLMEPEAVVQASLAGLRQGEVLCLPALADVNLLEEARASQGSLLARLRSVTLADRYLARE